MLRKITLMILFCVLFLFFSNMNVKANDNVNILNFLSIASNVNVEVTIIPNGKIIEDGSSLSFEIKKEEKFEGISKSVPGNNSFKSYESYKALTNKKSRQYKLQQVAETNEYGLRIVDGRYCVALGSYYTKSIGQYVDVVMENGAILECILGDAKADIHTDAATHRQNSNGNVVEFIVDKDSLHSMSKRMGDISYIGEAFKGSIKEIIVYEENYFD